MGFGLVGAIIGIVLAFLASRTRERQVRDAGYDGISMREREAINRLHAIGGGPSGPRPSGAAEYGCLFVLLPGIGFIVGVVVGALVT